METAVSSIVMFVFFAGVIQISKWLIALGCWLHEKLYVICYGERITPYCLFKIDGWTYTPYKIVERYKK